MASQNLDRMKEIKQGLKKRFDIKNLGEVKHYLGLEFTHQKEKITISQKTYCKDFKKIWDGKMQSWITNGTQLKVKKN